MNVKSIYLTPTKCIVLILRDDGVPCLLANLYLVSAKSNLAEKSLLDYALAIRRIYEFYIVKSINVELFLIRGNFEFLFGSIPEFFDSYLSNFKLGTHAFNLHVVCLRDFVLWVLKRYLHKNYNNRENYNSILIMNISKFEDLFSTFLLKNKTPNKYFKVIDLEKFERILFHLAKQVNEGASNTVRDTIILKLLIETGIRIGELLNLKTTDIIDENNTSYIKIHSSQIHDSRKYKPRVKNTQSFRIIALSSELSELLYSYIKKERRNNYKVKGSKVPHPFIFTSKLGNPLSKSSINKLFERINLLYNEENEFADRITPHKLRHTFAYNFLKFLIENKGLDMDRAKDELRITCGWSPSSTMPQLYAGKYVWEMANGHNLERINKMYEGNN